MIDWQALAQACRRANAAYVEGDADSKAAFAALGDVWIGQFQDASRQAVLSVDPSGAAWLAISGTRASQGALEDVLRDVELTPVTIKGGAVTKGVQDGMDRVYEWALATVPRGAALNITGHSLGSARCQLAPAYLPADRIGQMYGFAAPKFLSAEFFAAHAEVFKRLTPVVNGADGWCAWPWLDLRWKSRAPVPTVWLKDDRGTFSVLPDGNQWKGGCAFDDHDIGSYQKRLDVIAAASDIKPAA